MEIWDVYNSERQKNEKTMTRGSEFKKGEYHLVVHVCIFNSENQLLIQQRQPFKEGWPNMWDITVGGSAVAGDLSWMAAERETFEEIGLKIDLDNARPHMTINFDDGFDDIYLIKQDVDINKLKLQYEEVKKVKWANKDDIIKMVENGTFIPYYKEMIELLFAMKSDAYGCQSKNTKD